MYVLVLAYFVLDSKYLIHHVKFLLSTSEVDCVVATIGVEVITSVSFFEFTLSFTMLPEPSYTSFIVVISGDGLTVVDFGFGAILQIMQLGQL